MHFSVAVCGVENSEKENREAVDSLTFPSNGDICVCAIKQQCTFSTVSVYVTGVPRNCGINSGGRQKLTFLTRSNYHIFDTTHTNVTQPLQLGLLHNGM